MKIVIVKQRDLKDCGCCCLQSIIKYYHGFVPLEKIRRDTCTDSGGTTAYHLIESAKSYGFQSVGKRISINDLHNQIMPLIAHVILPNGYTHYVVIYRIKNNKVILMDPAKGKVIINIEEFKKIWSNVIIIFHPKNKIIHLPKNISILSIFFKYIYLFKNKYILFVLTNIFLMLFTLLDSFFLSYGLKSTNSIYTLLSSTFMFFFILVFKNIIDFLRGKITYTLNYLIDTSLLKDFIKHIFLLPLNILQSRTTGEIMTRVNELNNVKDLFTEIFISLFLDSVLVVISLIVIWFINWKLMLIILLSSLILILLNILSNKPLYKNIKDIIEKDSLYNECIIENINMSNSIKNLNLTNIVINRTEEKLNELYKSNLIFDKKFNFWGFIRNVFTEIIIFLISAICLYFVLKRVFDVSQVILIISLVSIYYDSLKKILGIIPKYNFFKASFEKISEFYSLEEENDEKLNNQFKLGDIEFKNITVSFDNYHKIIKNISLKLKNKSHTLLTGDSGVGKSTFLRCLLDNDLYDGNITISNVNLKDYNLKTVRENITYVGQNDKLFSDTIYNNITCYKNVSINRFYKICSLCLIDEIIKNKPFRYMSQIDDDLTNLSGGERQRIILARTLLTNANILVLDEALSEVDYEMEVKIIKNIREFFSNKTIIYVSHKNVTNCFENIVCLKKEGGV